MTEPRFSLTVGGVPFDSYEHPYKTDGCDRIYTLTEGVTVTMHLTEYPGHDAAAWVLYFENGTDHDSPVLDRICDSDIKIPLNVPAAKRLGHRFTPQDLCVTAVKGMITGADYLKNDKESAEEFSEVPFYLRKGEKKSVACTDGRSSDGWMPFFRISAQNAGVIAAVGWTGGWKALFSAEESGVVMQTGLALGTFYLKPGERLRTTSVLIMEYAENEDPYNKFRRLIREHYAHDSYVRRDGLLAYEVWGGLTSDEMKKRIGELAAHGVRFEDVWTDAGWYGNCTKCDDPFAGDWGRYTGDWTMNPRVHPDGMCDVRDTAKAAGMRLMLWLEPERAAGGTNVTKEHPDWLIPVKYGDGKPNGQYLVNYGNQEALEAVYQTIAGYVRSLDLSCYRQDFNMGLSNTCRFADEEGRTGITELYHILGMYRLWDRLHEEFPDLVIDDCSSGGRRIDIETLQRAVPFFRSDYQCTFNESSEVLQAHHSGASKYLPYTGCTTKTKADTYAARSSYSACWGGAFYNAVFQTMSEEDFAWARERVEEYREIRRYFNCDFYDSGSVGIDDTAWAIRQYHDPATDSGIVMAFRREKSPFDTVNIPLRGLKDGKTYRVTSFDGVQPFTVNGSMTVRLPEKRSSVIFKYE